MEHKAFYFGCLDGPGHYLHFPGGRVTSAPKLDIPGFVWSLFLLDTGLLRNGRHQDFCDGKVFWTCGGNNSTDDMWHAFFWWDRSVDSRPGSNSGFYVHGFQFGQAEEAFAHACAVWPQVVKRQKHLLTLQNPPPRKKLDSHD